MTITLVLPKPPSYSETFFRSKINGLQKSGHKVILVTGKTNYKYSECSHFTHPGVSKNKTIQILKMIWEFLKLIPFLKRVFRFVAVEKEYDSSLRQILERIYINATLLKLDTDWLHFGFATMAINRESVAKAIEAKAAVSFRGYDIGIYPLSNKNCYDRLWKTVDKVHYISTDLYDKALKLGLSKSVPSKKITPAIDVGKFDPSQDIMLSLNSSKINLLTIGRLHWKKGYVDTIQALLLLKQSGIEFNYKIIGDGPEYERIAYAAYQMGLADQVNFLGRLNHEDVRTHLGEADMYVQYSIQEGFCNAVLEAQAMGKLCVVSNAEGLSENVIDGETGWVVPRLQPHLLAKKIIEIIELNPIDQNRITQNAIKRVQKQFNIAKQQEEFNQFYSSNKV